MPDDPTWTEREIEERANDIPAYVPPLPGIEPDISQDPDLFDEEHQARFGMPLARAALVAGTAAAMVATMVGFLGTGEHPSNHNFITVEYSRDVAPSPIGDGPWCDMAISVAANRSGNIVAVCGGPRRGFAYTPAHAWDFKRRGLWHAGLHGVRIGDVVFFNWSRKKGGPDDVEHVGIVEHVYADGTVATDEGNIGDACRREHRDSTYVVGYGRPPYTAQQQEDDMPSYVSLGMKKPQAVKSGQAARATFDTEYSDKDKAHADGPHPGILAGGKNGAQFVIEVDASGVDGTMRLIETDPEKDYAISKTYPSRPIGSETFVGLCDADQHLYVEVSPTADGDVSVAAKAQYWHR